jgi:hypothetical protein
VSIFVVKIRHFSIGKKKKRKISKQHGQETFLDIFKKNIATFRGKKL